MSSSVIRACVLTGMWVIALLLMASFTLQGADVEHLPLLGWSLLAGMIGSCVAMWEVIAYERARVEAIARSSAEIALEHHGPYSVDA